MNKVVVVTGASRGIGKAIALRFAKEGYDVAVNYHGNQKKAEEVVQECIKYGVQAKSYRCNVASYDEVDQMMKDILADFDHIDVLINNSGITRDCLLLKMSSESFDAVIDVNLKGTFHTIKALSRTFMKQRSGVIINMASVVGIIGNIGQTNYAASKAGVIAMTKSLAKELASRNIRVNAIAPGYIETDMTSALQDSIKLSMAEQIPLKVFGKGEDVAAAACFLASDDAKYITGQVIHVDGGMVM